MCLELLKKNQYASEEQAFKKKDSQNLFRLKESAYENLGFPDNMSYEQRAELRKECSKFLRFTYLIDFLALEGLLNVYKYSVNELISQFALLVEDDSIHIVKDKNSKSKQSSEPIFYLTVDFSFTQIEEEHVEIQELKEFVAPPIGKSRVEEDFNMLYHVHLKEAPEQEEGSPPLEEDEEVPLDVNRVYQRRIVPSISSLWLSLKPSAEVFFADLMRCVTEGLSCIQSFQRWSRHDEMTAYVSVLEEWDDIVGNDWEAPASNFLNPQDWLEL